MDLGQLGGAVRHCRDRIQLKKNVRPEKAAYLHERTCWCLLPGDELITDATQEEKIVHVLYIEPELNQISEARTVRVKRAFQIAEYLKSLCLEVPATHKRSCLIQRHLPGYVDQPVAGWDGNGMGIVGRRGKI